MDIHTFLPLIVLTGFGTGSIDLVSLVSVAGGGSSLQFNLAWLTASSSSSMTTASERPYNRISF